MHDLSLSQLSLELEQGHLSSYELTEHLLKRIAAHDSQLNSMITVTATQALAAAKQADSLRKQNQANALTGIPYIHKDIFCTQDVLTSCGSKILENFISPYDATVTQQLKQAGMVMLGKANMDEFAMGSSNENSHYGPVKNPWQLDYVPGGSSGGSAAAIAAQFAPVATGSDTGGSIRQPAAFTNLTGIKPSYGRVSRYGMVAFASSLDQGGPMARSAEDCAMMLNAMSGHDPLDSTSLPLAPLTIGKADLHQPLKGLRVGLPKEYFTDSLNTEMRDRIEAAAKTLEALGCDIVNISLPHSHLAVSVYYVVAPAEASSNLARYDGVRYGYRCENPVDLQDLYLRSRSEGFGVEVKRRIMVGTFVLSSGYYDAYYLQAQKVRQLIRNDFLDAFKQVDVILSPTTPQPAFKLGERMADPIQMYLADLYTIPANLAGLPALSAPAGFINGLPVGFQLIGKDLEEAKILAVAHQYQQVTNWHLQQPAFNTIV